jgi:hypothetical protein
MAQSRKAHRRQKTGQYALAERIGVFRTHVAKALPYYTLNGSCSIFRSFFFITGVHFGIYEHGVA